MRIVPVSIRALALAAAIASSIFAGAANAETLNVGTEKNTCRFCHAPLGKSYEKSIHGEFEIACTVCHGGDATAIDRDEAMSPAKGFKGKISPRQIPELCASCHGDYVKMRQYGLPTNQLKDYEFSVHGVQLLQKGNDKVAQCVSCHTSHDIRRISDPEATVYPKNVPGTCIKCHGDAKLMAQFGLSTKEADDYKQSLHYKKLSEGDETAPSCASCHGSHGAVPPGLTEVINVCGKCHIGERDAFSKSAHFKNGLMCLECHSNHKVESASEAIYDKKEKGGCKSCHPDGKKDDKALATIAAIKETMIKAKMGISEAEKDIKNAESSGMDVRNLERILEEANKGMKAFGAAQHRLDEKAVDEVISRAVNAKTEEIQNEVEVFFAAVRNKKILYGIIGCCVLMLIVIVGIRMTLKNEEASESKKK